MKVIQMEELCPFHPMLTLLVRVSTSQGAVLEIYKIKGGEQKDPM